MTGLPDIGIGAIAWEIPEGRLDNLARAAELAASESLIRNKIGVLTPARMAPGQDTSNLAAAAVRKLLASGALQPEEAECLIVVTQNPDGTGLPNVASIVHGQLGLPTRCASFDLSLGCSGFVYGVSVAASFMRAQGFRRGILVTADPYSKIVSLDDRNTSLLFGDGAAATLLTDDPVWRLGQFDFGSDGSRCSEIAVQPDTRQLHMNGRAVVEFCVRIVPNSVHQCLDRNGITLQEVDRFLLHQGSRHIVQRIGEVLGVSADRAPFAAAAYGNTVSSSIALMLGSELVARDRCVVICGFGVGLSWGTGVLFRVR